MKQILPLSIVVGIFLFPATTNAQAILDWAFNLGSDNNYAYDHCYDVNTDADGNVYITGYFRDTVDFDPGAGEALEFYSIDKNYAYLAKYSSAGDFIWVITLGDSYGQASGESINFDNDGNIVWTGWILGTVDFDPGPGTAEVSGFTSSATSIFLAKYSPDGDYMMALSVGGYYSSVGKQIIIDDDNNILLLGSFQETVDFDPSGAEYELISDNFYGDMFFAKYSPTGNFIFAKMIASEVSADNFDHGEYAAEDSEGNIFICGMYDGTCDFDPDAGVTELTSDHNVVFFAKYDADMNFLWVKSTGASGTETEAETHALYLDEDENIYLAGWFKGDLNMNPDNGDFILEHSADEAHDIFFAKYSNAGDLVWAKTIGGDGYDYARKIIAKNNKVYISGEFYSEMDFDPGSGTAKLKNENEADEEMYIAVYDANGNYLHASGIDGTIFSAAYAANLHIDESGNFYLAGYFSESADFDCTATDYSLTSNGDYDIFLAKYDSIITLPVAIHETEKIELEVYPNPATEFVLIDLPQNVQETVITLFDANMRELAIHQVNEKQITIPVSQYHPGIYFLQLQNNEKIYYAKLVIE